MKKMLLIAAAISLTPSVLLAGPVTLANDEWPPFILEGERQGTAEKLVCEAMQRSGHPCAVKVADWNLVLKRAQGGEIDGIAAVWHTPEREGFLLYSEPYLTNRIVPVVSNEFDAFIRSADDLAGLRVALVTDYAYGDEISAANEGFAAVPSKSSLEALQLLRRGEADVALVDELVARNNLERPEYSGLTALRTVLSLRSLHFAVSRQHPNAEELMDDFHRAYRAMLADGTVNEILGVDWLATDFGQAGEYTVVMRSGVSLDDLSNPEEEGSMYALDQSDYQWMRQRDFDKSEVNYQVDGQSYSSLQSAMNKVFGENAACKHNEFTSTFDCSNLFKNR